MKKIFQFLCVLFILSSLIFPQRVFDSITISDEAGGSKVLVFGLDSLATDGIDVQFGESDLPPFPPTGAFEARFNLPENGFSGTLSSYSDFRNVPSFPFTGQKEFRLAYQVGTGTVIKIDWNFPGTVTGLLQDIIIGTLINVPMTGTGTYTVTNPSGFNRLKMFINYDGSIPVELVSFNASVSGSSVKLDWATATETNNSGFEVQRKSENSDWEKIGFVQGAGTTTEKHSYTYTDESIQGSYYYRLRQIDFDGTSTFSKEVYAEVDAPSQFKLNQNYPNPFNPSTTISFSIPNATQVSLSIYNQIGQKVGELVNKGMEAGSYNYTWNAENQSSGIYFFELQTNEFRSVRKMTLLK